MSHDSLDQAVSQADIHTLQAVTKELHSRLEAAFEALDRKEDLIQDLILRVGALETQHAEVRDEVRGALYGYEEPEGGVPADESDEQRAARVGLLVRVSEIDILVRGRNRSAPTKRNMTDADAVRVLTGDVANLGHKEAGEAIGLTYAQVYSCRLEYTFKHIHKKLKTEGWKNTFVK